MKSERTHSETVRYVSCDLKRECWLRNVQQLGHLSCTFSRTPLQGRRRYGTFRWYRRLRTEHALGGSPDGVINNRAVTLP